MEKSLEETVTALNLLNAVKLEQVPERGEDDMDLMVEIDFEEMTLCGYTTYDSNASQFCSNLLDIVRRRKQEEIVNSEVLKDAITELQNQKIPSYK